MYTNTYDVSNVLNICFNIYMLRHYICITHKLYEINYYLYPLGTANPLYVNQYGTPEGRSILSNIKIIAIFRTA